MKVPFFVFFFISCYDHDVQQRYLENGLSTHRHFSTKLILITTRSSATNQRLHSFNFTLVNKSHSQHCGCCPLRRTPFCNFVRMRTSSLVPKPNITFISLGTRLVHMRNRESLTTGTALARSLPVVVDKVYEHHTGKALNSAANL